MPMPEPVRPLRRRTMRAITAGTLNFAAGDTEKTVDVTINGDSLDELDETVILRLSAASNASLDGGGQTLDGTGTITDDDAAPTVSVANASAVTEGNDSKATTNMSFTVSLSAASGQAVTVPYTLSGTATATDDYTDPATKEVEIAAGARSAARSTFRSRAIPSMNLMRRLLLPWGSRPMRALPPLKVRARRPVRSMMTMLLRPFRWRMPVRSMRATTPRPPRI